MKTAGCEEILQETASGAKSNRPVLVELLNKIRPGDVIVVWKLDRLGRPLKHLVDLINELVEKEVGLISLQNPIDTPTHQGRLVFNIFASLAEFERDLIIELTQTGLRAARQRGRTGGCPKGLSPAVPNKTIAAEALYTQDEFSIKEICDNLGIRKATLYQDLRHRGVQIGTSIKSRRPKILKVRAHFARREQLQTCSWQGAIASRY